METNLAAEELDSTVPTQEQYNRLYGYARRVFDHAPWETMYETQILAVRGTASGKTQFISVMGNLGEHLAVAFYPSLKTLDTMQGHKDNFQDSIDCIMGQQHLQLVFDRKSDLLDGEAGTIKKSGVAFGKETGGKWPSAQSLVPGYAPLKAGGEELERMLEGVEQLLHKLDTREPIPEITSVSEAICSRIYADGIWQDTMLKYDMTPDMMQSVFVPSDLLEKFHALPVDNQKLVCGCFTIPMPMGSSKKRTIMPKIMMTMDRETGMIGGTIVSEPPTDGIWKLEQAFTAWLEKIIKSGTRPQSIRFEGWYLSSFSSVLCKSLHVKEDTKPCPEIYDVFQKLLTRLTGSALR